MQWKSRAENDKSFIRKGVLMVDTRDGVAIEEQIDCFEMKEVDLEGVEELEKAIAPGIFGFGCGCNVGNVGIFCG